MFDLIPFRNRSLERKLNSLSAFIDSFFSDDFYPTISSNIRADIKETDDAYLVEAELPGFNKEDIKIELNDNILKISAEHKEENKEERENYIKRERRYGKFERLFQLDNIKQDKAKAEYKNGILSIKLPKAKKDTEKRFEIKID